MRYYYGQLTKPLQGVYDTLLSGFRVYAPSIRIPDVEQGQLAEVYLRLKLDEPLLFYVTGYRCRWMPGAAHLELARPEAKVLHPGPMNRGLEISNEIADAPASLVLDQVAAGVATRMAVLYLLATRNDGGNA